MSSSILLTVSVLQLCDIISTVEHFDEVTFALNVHDAAPQFIKHVPTFDTIAEYEGCYQIATTDHGLMLFNLKYGTSL